MCSNAVAPSYSNDINEHVMTRCVGERHIQAPARMLCKKAAASGTADAVGAATALLSWTTAKAMSPWYPTNQLLRSCPDPNGALPV